MATEAHIAKRERPRALSLCALPHGLLYGQQIKIGGDVGKFSTVKYVMRGRPGEADETLERLIDQARAGSISEEKESER